MKRGRFRGANWPAHPQFLNSQVLPEACWCHCPGRMLSPASPPYPHRPPPSTAHSQGDSRESTSHGKNTGPMHGSVQHLMIRTTGCTEEGPQSPLQLGSDGDGEAGGGAASHKLPDSQKHTLCSWADVLNTSE